MTKNKYHFEDNHIVLDSMPKNFKKMTATRFAAALGLNRWTSPFQVWCALTRTWEQPFEDSIYTIAGKVIEPKIQKYLDQRFFMNVTIPEDVYGEDFFKKTWGDFFHNKKIFGGMWDALGHDDETGEDFVIEIKTTKRAEDWKDGAPEYYKLQAALYTYLLGLDKFVIPASFLVKANYDEPDKFVPSVENTAIFEYSLSKDYPNFEKEYIKPAKEFWKKYVESGISPDFDEKVDAEPLKALRTVEVADDSDFDKVLKEYDENQVKIADFMKEIQPALARQVELKDIIKKHLREQFKEDTKYAEVSSKHFTLKMTKSERHSVDSKKLKADGLFDKYSKTSQSFTLREMEKESD
jgi:hypothetical protein